jgi:uncharacterized damage-inducible protein DinB
MLTLLRDLTAHKGWANAALLRAICQHDAAAADPDLRTLLHHILIANRFWLYACLAEPFDLEAESRVSDSVESLIDTYRSTHEREVGWLAALGEAGLAVTVESPLMPGRRRSVSEALIQMSLHSQGHRSQCATMLRRLGGSPPTTDFILWVSHRRDPLW